MTDHDKIREQLAANLKPPPPQPPTGAVTGWSDDDDVPDFQTLEEAREWVAQQRYMGRRPECPCCDEPIGKVWHTRFPGEAARVLIDMYHAGGKEAREWVHVPSLPHYKGGDAVKSKHWGLIEPHPDIREDGSPRNGVWRLGLDGLSFALNKTSILSHADIGPRATLLSISGKPLWITEAVGRKFNYGELMRDNY